MITNLQYRINSLQNLLTCSFTNYIIICLFQCAYLFLPLKFYYLTFGSSLSLSLTLLDVSLLLFIFRFFLLFSLLHFFLRLLSRFRLRSLFIYFLFIYSSLFHFSSFYAYYLDVYIFMPSNSVLTSTTATS